MLRKISIVCACVFLTACIERQPVESWNTETVDLSAMKGLEGCSMFFLKMRNMGGVTYVIRCKGAETNMISHSSGKSKQQMTLIDDNSSSIDERIEKLNAYKKELSLLNQKYDVKTK